MAGAEMIGRGCECVNPFEKSWIDRVFDEFISVEEAKINKAKADVAKDKQDYGEQDLPAQTRNLVEALPAWEIALTEAKTVKERFSAIPSCQ